MPYRSRIFCSFCKIRQKRCIPTIITHRNHYVRSAEQRIRRFCDLSFNPTQTTLLHRHLRIRKMSHVGACAVSEHSDAEIREALVIRDT
jgi:hypothetical protein